MATIPASENEFPQVLLTEGAAAATPGTGLVVAYAKSDGLPYSKDDAGTESPMTPNAHIADSADAHDASAISIVDAGTLYTATDVEGALAEVMGAVAGGGIPATTVDAKGDLIAGTANDTVDNVTAGANGTILSADSAQTAGLAWIALDHTHAAAGSGATGGGTTLNPDIINMTGLVRMSTEIVSTVNADQNDYNPAGLHDATSIRFTSFSANRTITGIVAGSTGEMLILVNNTAFSMLLTNEAAGSSANNRFRTPNAATVTVRQSGSALCFYLGGRWTVIGA